MGNHSENHTAVNKARPPRAVLSPSRRPPRAQRPTLRQLRLRPTKPGTTASDLNTTRFGQPIDGPTDPRWVLAVRTAEQLEGDILIPERREKLLRLAKPLGLTQFAASLVIAIVQDQARRGHPPLDCPTAGEEQLRMVSLPGSSDASRRKMHTAFAVAALLAVELIIIQWWLFV